jgi:DMSO/TMAO reductase YedYZ molybdopterin-dependent catalytic subunit
MLGGAAAVGGGFLSVPVSAWAPTDRKKVNMIVRSAHPLDLEMPLDGFLTEFTPTERFFSRTHHYEVKVDVSTWRLEIGGMVANPQKLTFEQIQKLPKVEVPAVMECAGNGRAFYEPTVPGIQWEYGGVANGRWAGARLADVLKLAGVQSQSTDLVFDGADVPVGTMPEFIRSIPLAKAMHPDTILAYELNGEPLPSLHGYPLRLVAPGWASDSWVKWVTRIQVADKPYDGFFMKNAYRHPGRPVKPGSAVDPAMMQPVTELRPKSVIATPLDGTEAAIGKALVVKGVAWTGSEGHITSVELTFDGGQTWVKPQMSPVNKYSWRNWQYTHTPSKAAFLQIGARASDGKQSQPMIASWNPSGYLYNAVQMIGVNVVADPKAAAPPPPEHSTMSDAPAAVKSNCIGCHQADVITQQRLTHGQWEKEVEKMGRWGSSYKAEDKNTIVEYLSKEFPYTKR